MCGTAASVSTLLIVVGMPKTPATAGNGGLIRGLPRFPSIEFIIAVSSPQMYAPAPRCSTMSIRVPLPNASGAERALGVGLLHRGRHDPPRLGELAANVDVGN